MDIRIFNSTEELSSACAQIFIEQLAKKPSSVLGLATGASPVETYKRLIEAYSRGEVSFAEATSFNLDEYCSLARSHPQSYHSFMHANLFDKIDIKSENINILDGNAPDKAAECRRFDEKMEKTGIDLQLLGIGNNGHIGFNEPAESFTEGSFMVELTESTIAANSRYFPDGDMPRQALTMGIASIMRAKKIVLIAMGEAKAQAVFDMVKGPVTPACPASVLQNHPDAVILLDKSAAGLL